MNLTDIIQTRIEAEAEYGIPTTNGCLKRTPNTGRKLDMVTIDTSKIPPLERRLLGATFYAAMKRFYENPENVRRFEDWQRSSNKGMKTNEG